MVDELRQEFPELETFVTLSPISRLHTWLSTQPDGPAAQSLLNGDASDEDIRDMAASYLLTAKTDRGTPFDPVARFHLRNGAQIYAFHANADLSKNGRAQSSGAMVNYHYDLAQIERNPNGSSKTAMFHPPLNSPNLTHATNQNPGNKAPTAHRRL